MLDAKADRAAWEKQLRDDMRAEMMEAISESTRKVQEAAQEENRRLREENARLLEDRQREQDAFQASLSNMVAESNATAAQNIQQIVMAIQDLRDNQKKTGEFRPGRSSKSSASGSSAWSDSMCPDEWGSSSGAGESNS